MPLIIEADAGEPDFATVLVDVSVAGRPYRLVLDTGAARTQLSADEYTMALRPVDGHTSSGSGTFGRRVTDPVVTVSDVAIGPLALPTLEVTRSDRGLGHLLGMDVLGRYRCRFRLDAGVVELDLQPETQAGNQLTLGSRGHIYIDVGWPGITARACWDTGAGATVVDRAFWLSHPELFEQIGVTTGTDASGDQTETPVLLMAGPVIGQHTFRRHKAVAVDLAAVNDGIEIPMDLILGYPTIRQADWLFDFPAKRWAVQAAANHARSGTPPCT